MVQCHGVAVVFRVHPMTCRRQVKKESLHPRRPLLRQARAACALSSAAHAEIDGVLSNMSVGGICRFVQDQTLYIVRSCSWCWPPRLVFVTSQIGVSDYRYANLRVVEAGSHDLTY